MRSSILPAVLILGVALLWGTGATAQDADFKFQLELAKAKAKGRSATVAREIVAAPARPDYATAYYQSMRDGKPLVIHVNGFDCKDACKECLASGSCRTCDAAEILGDSTPRLILAAPTGGKLLKANEWRTGPTAKQIKAAIGDCADDCPNGVCAPGQSCGVGGGPSQSFGGSCANGQCSPANGGFRFLRR